MDVHADPQFVLGRFSQDGREPFTGVVVDDRVIPLGDTPAATESIFDDWTHLVDVLSNWLRDSSPRPSRPAGVPVAELTTLAPVVPGQIFGSGANYRTHVVDLLVAKERQSHPDADLDALRAQFDTAMRERAVSGTPFAFVGLPSAVCGPYDDVVLPRAGEQHDWELELGVVIGRAGRDVPREQALDYVAGYTIVNDLTTRDLVFRSDIPGINTDFFAGKNAPTFFPTGPYLVPTGFIDPTDLRLVLRLNGEVMQDGHTSDMIFDVPRLVEYISSVVELRPGDLIATGSPAGNGAHYGRFLRPGDVLEGEISGLGVQRNRCVAMGGVTL